MWTIRILLVTVIAICNMLSPLPIMAASTGSVNITIYAAGYTCTFPGGFTTTYISDTEVELSWVAGLGANNTMVRAAYGRLPADRTDGYLVYYGNSTVASDTALNLDDTASIIYYRAWSESAAGAWEDTGTSGFMEGPAMKLIAIVLLCVAIMVWAWQKKQVSLLFISLMCWLGFTAYMYSIGSADWDYYRIFAWAGIGLVLITVYQVIIVQMNNKNTMIFDPDPNVEHWQDVGEMQRQVGMIRGRGIPPRRKGNQQ